MEHGGDRGARGVLLLHEVVGVAPAPARRELPRHLLRWAGTDPRLGRARVATEAERRGPPRNDGGAWHPKPDEFCYQQAERFVPKETAKPVWPGGRGRAGWRVSPLDLPHYRVPLVEAATQWVD